MPDPLLVVEELRAYLETPRGIARAVDGVSFTLNRGETLALVGESGCGKSMTALSLLQLIPEPAGYIESGRILFEGVDLLDYTWDEMRALRGREIGMIFQEPMTSLNPTFAIGTQIMEAMTAHGAAVGRVTRRRAEEMLARVGLRDPAGTMRQYPHELSGGMRQRVLIAMALANAPKLLVADEPTTALDVTIQAQILALLHDLQRETGMAMLLITHDLGVVANVADRVAVMYAGQIVETAPTPTLFRTPRHPYTAALFASRPSRAQRGHDLATLTGSVPQATAWPLGCRFAPRCPARWDVCDTSAPRPVSVGSDTVVRCHLYDPTMVRPAAREALSEEASRL